MQNPEEERRSRPGHVSPSLPGLTILGLEQRQISMTQSGLNVASRGSSQDDLIDLCSSPTSTGLSTSQAITDCFKEMMSGWIVVIITISPLLCSHTLPTRIEHHQQVRASSQNSRSLAQLSTSRFLSSYI